MPKKIIFNGISGQFDTISEVALAAAGSTPNTSGASISADQTLTLQPADGSNPGIVSTGTQTLAGNKTFSGSISASNLSGTNTGDQTITLSGAVSGTGTGAITTTYVLPSTEVIYVDKGRADSYTATGSVLYPYKTIQAAINAIQTAGDNTDSKPYSINIATGYYAENLVISGADFLNLAMNGHGSVSVDSLTMSVSDDLWTFVFLGITVVNSTSIIGATDGGTAFAAGGEFRNCNFYDVTLKNLTSVYIKDSAISGPLVVENVVACAIQKGQATGAITNTWAAANPKPGGAPYSYLTLEALVTTGAITVSAGAYLQTRIGTRLGSPGGTISCAGNFTAYNSFIRAGISIGATGTFVNSGSFYDPSTLTITPGGTHTNNTYAEVLRNVPSGNLAATNVQSALNELQSDIDTRTNVTLAASGSTPNANGATLTGQVLNLEPADATYAGIVSTGGQTFAGNKYLAGITSIGGTLATIEPLTSSDIIGIGSYLVNSSTASVQPAGIWNALFQTKIDSGAQASNQTRGSLKVALNITPAVLTTYAGNYRGMQFNATNGLGNITGTMSGGTVAATTTVGATTSKQVGLLVTSSNSSGIVQTATGVDVSTTHATGTDTVAHAAVGIRVANSAITASGSSVSNTATGIEIKNNITATDTTPVVYAINSLSTAQSVFAGTLTASNLTGTNTGDITLAAVGASPNANGASLSSQVLTLQPANTSNPGVLTSTDWNTFNNKVSAVSGDIVPTSFSAAQTTTGGTVTGLAFANGSIRGFEAIVTVTVVASSNLYEIFTLTGVQRGVDWVMSATSAGDTSGFEFTINTSGQVLYDSLTYAGFSSATVKFRAKVLAV